MMAIRPIVRSTLKVLAWNVYQGHRTGAVRRELAKMIAEEHPDVIVLTEATHQHDLTGLGYDVIHYPSQALTRGNQPETADTAIMVRHGLKVRRHIAREFFRPP